MSGRHWADGAQILQQSATCLNLQLICIGPYRTIDQNCYERRLPSCLTWRTFSVFSSVGLRDGRSKRSKFSTSWATFERQYHPKHCVLLENPLFVRFATYLVYNARRTRATGTYMSTAQKRKRFITATLAMKSAVRTEFLNKIQKTTVWVYYSGCLNLFRSHVYSIMTLPTVILFI
jgi:hypothetical protein